MKKLQMFFNESRTRADAGLLSIIFYVVMIFFLMCLVLAFMGRQTFTLRTGTGVYERATYAESRQEVPDYGSTTGLTTASADQIHVVADDNDRVDLAAHIALSLMYASTVLPAMLGYWFLSRVFSNVGKGAFFIEQNARLILYYGLLQFFSAFLVPLIKFLICALAGGISGCQISCSVNAELLNPIFQGFGFLVAAYIIYYGIHLQDEVDHTI